MIMTAYLGYAVLAWLVLVWAFRPFWEDAHEGRHRLHSHRLGWMAEVVYAVHSNHRRREDG